MIDRKKQAKSKIFLNIARKKRMNKNIFLYGFIFIFTVGYGLFFTSRSWFPGRDELVIATKFNKVNVWESRELMLVDWEYAPTQHRMEIQIDIKNKAYDGIDKYEFSAIDRKEGYLDVETVVESSDYIVVRIENLKPSWSEISFRVEIPGSSNSSIFKMYTNKYDVKRVDSIEERTENEYRMVRLQNTVNIYEGSIYDLNSEIKKKEKTIESCKKDINDLERKKQFQTEIEIKDTNRLINDVVLKINRLETEIKDELSDIEEFQRRIVKLNEQIEAYR